MKIGCVVMAAGKSSRFGSNKLLADLGGVPLLCRTLEHLPFHRLDRVVTVASSPRVAALCQSWPVSVVLYPGGPQSETIRRGIEAMDDMDGCVFMPGDQPLCRPDSFVRLLDAFSAQPSHAFRFSPAVFAPLSGSCKGSRGVWLHCAARAKLPALSRQNIPGNCGTPTPLRLWSRSPPLLPSSFESHLLRCCIKQRRFFCTELQLDLSTVSSI